MSAKSFYFENKKSEESDDHSSASSIPWNSDAIKQNQMNWQHIERMLHYEEPLPDDLEPELRQEILDWQMKFPQLAETKTNTNWEMPQHDFKTSSTNISEILDLSSSIDDDESIEDERNFDNNKFLETPKPINEKPKERFRFVTKRVAHGGGDYAKLADLFGKDLHITPLTLRQRRSARLLEQRKSTTSSTISDSPVPAKTIKYKNTPTKMLQNEEQQRTNRNYNNVATNKVNTHFHMPPILNVLETKRRFCALSNNRSFVQLTQVQQAKSAAVHSTARQAPTERQYRVWNKPALAAVSVNSRFLNNRNSIILPALQQQHSTSTNSEQSIDDVEVTTNRRHFVNSYSRNSNSTLSSGDIHRRQPVHMMLHSNSQTTSTSGRSISAVPMHLHGAFYHL